MFGSKFTVGEPDHINLGGTELYVIIRKVVLEMLKINLEPLYCTYLNKSNNVNTSNFYFSDN